MRTQRFWLTLTLTLLFLDCAGLAVLFVLSRPAQRADSQPVQVNSLINLQGKRLDSEHPTCRVIHYTAKTCSFCEKENPVWLRLKFNALAKRCDVVSLVPNVAELPASSSPDTALFVSTEFARTLGATRTPTTVITDSTGHVIWMKEGMMSEADENQAVSFLQNPSAP